MGCGSRKYGALYNWYAVRGITVPPVIEYGVMYNWWVASLIGGTGVGSIAPAGSHVPSLVEDYAMMLYLDASGTGNSNIAGGKLKAAGFDFWDSPNTDATNASGYNLRGSGYRSSVTGLFASRKIQSGFWNLEEALNPLFGHYTFCFNASGVYYCTDPSDYNPSANAPKNAGLPIRLIKDSTTLTNGQTGTLTDGEGNIYPTICIGSQERMSVNLISTKFNDGTLIPKVTDNTAWVNLVTPGYCWYNNIPS